MLCHFAIAKLQKKIELPKSNLFYTTQGNPNVDRMAMEQNSSDAAEQTISNVAPERWEYMVVAFDQLFDRATQSFTPRFYVLGNEGWEYVGSIDGFSQVFKRRLP